MMRELLLTDPLQNKFNQLIEGVLLKIIKSKQY